MKKILIAATTLLFLLTSCNQQPTLEGSEFSNDNIIVEGVDSMWMDLKSQIDASIESSKAELIAQIEEETGEKLTDEQLAELDKQLSEQIQEKYDEGRQEVDSIQSTLKIAVALTFMADGKMSMKIDSETNGEADTQQMDGTYQFDGKKVILSYDNQQDTLVLQADGNELFGRINENTFSSTLKRTK